MFGIEIQNPRECPSRWSVPSGTWIPFLGSAEKVTTSTVASVTYKQRFLDAWFCAALSGCQPEPFSQWYTLVNDLWLLPKAWFTDSVPLIYRFSVSVLLCPLPSYERKVSEIRLEAVTIVGFQEVMCVSSPSILRYPLSFIVSRAWWCKYGLWPLYLWS